MGKATASYDVLVLGAGIVGAACALACTREGLRVAVVEPGVAGGGATAAGMGHLVVMDDSPAQLALTQLSRRLWRELRPALPAAVEYDECGTLWVAADEEEMHEVVAKQRTCKAAGIAAEVLDARALSAAEPGLRAGLAGALRVTEDGVLYPPAAAEFLLAEARRSGAAFLQGRAAVAAAHGAVTLEDGTVLHAERVVVATGNDLRVAPWLPIQPRKGHLVITDRYPGVVHHQLVELGYLKSAHKVAADSVAFNVQPRPTGQLLIGSSRQYGNREAAADAVMLGRMLARAVEYLPGLAGLSAVRVWTGFRAATEDKLPLLGPVDDDESLVLAMGFEGLGITNALGAARLVVDHVLGRVSPIDATPYLPSRLGPRRGSGARVTVAASESAHA